MRQGVTQMQGEELEQPWYSSLRCSFCRAQRIGPRGIFILPTVVLCPTCAPLVREVIDIGMAAE